MKKYETPEVDFVMYETEDTLTTSDIIEKETEDIGGILEDLA